MGAEEFQTKGKGKTVEEAFREAVRRAQYDYGHRGYTGSIAEKNEFVVIEPPKNRQTDEERMQFANELLESWDHRINDKWGPAGAIKLSDNEWFFFGWASS